MLLDLQAQQDHWALPAQLAQQDQLAQGLLWLDQPDLQVLLAQQVYKAFKALQDPLAHKVSKVTLAQLDLKAYKA